MKARVENVNWSFTIPLRNRLEMRCGPRGAVEGGFVRREWWYWNYTKRGWEQRT